MGKRVSERIRLYESGIMPREGAHAAKHERKQRVIVIGHKNPDTYSIAAAAASNQI